MANIDEIISDIVSENTDFRLSKYNFKNDDQFINEADDQSYDDETDDDPVDKIAKDAKAAKNESRKTLKELNEIKSQLKLTTEMAQSALSAAGSASTAAALGAGGGGLGKKQVEDLIAGAGGGGSSVTIADDLVTNDAAKALSAKQGVVVKGYIDNLVSLSGESISSTGHGTFTGSTISDNVNTKIALQELETALEAIPTKKQSVVPDIAGRDALTNLSAGDIAYVTDASSDATVTSGAALYVSDGTNWFKIAEFESLDLNIKKVVSFNATTDWGSASGGYYSYTITKTVHGITTPTNISVFESVSGGYVETQVDQISVSNTDSVVLRVPETPDGRFAGRVSIV